MIFFFLVQSAVRTFCSESPKALMERAVTSLKVSTCAGDYIPVCFTPWDANNKKEETKQLQPLDSPLIFVLGLPLTCQLNATDISKRQSCGASRWRCLLAGHRINCSISVNVWIFFYYFPSLIFPKSGRKMNRDVVLWERLFWRTNKALGTWGGRSFALTVPSLHVLV